MEYGYFKGRTKPKRILEEQWAEEACDVFDKEALEYYPEDDILLTEDGELVDNRGVILGTDWEEELISGKTDEVYIRNEGIGTDYMIVLRQGLGMDHINPDI